MTRYLQAQELRLPLALDAPEVARYVTDRVIGLSASRTRFVWAAVRIFLDADERGCCRRRIGQVPQFAPAWSSSAVAEYTTFLRSHRGLALRTVGKRVWQLTRFAAHLETVRRNTIRTRNARLAAIHSFFRYVLDSEPALALLCQRVLAIPVKKAPRPVLGYLRDTELAHVLAQIALFGTAHAAVRGRRGRGRCRRRRSSWLGEPSPSILLRLGAVAGEADRPGWSRRSSDRT